MISAGEDALLKILGGAVSVFYEPRDLATEVYRAMRSQDDLAHTRCGQHNPAGP